jgi:hypothetical protein
MALRNPYSAYARHGAEDDERQALLDALDEPPPMQARARTPTRPVEQTREMLSGPGARTQYMDPAEAAEIGRNAFSGDRFGDERQEPIYEPPSTAAANTGAQPRTSGAAPFQSNMSRGYALMDEYDDPYARRNEGSGGAGSGALKGLSYGSAAGPAGMAVGAAAGAIAGAFTKNAKTARTDFAIDDAKQMISQAHEDAFGRPITPEYLDQIVRGQGWQDGDRWMGQDQLAYVLDAFANQAPGDRAAQAAANAAAATPAAGATPAGATAGGTGGGLPFSGFDFNRAQDPSKSAKDAFAALAQQAPQLTDTSKAGAEAWFRQHIAPGMEAAGYKVFDVQGDKAWVGAREDPEGRVPVDFLINAGGSNVQIGWQPDSGGGGGLTGGTAQNAQDAYAQLSSSIDPNASKEEMESAIEAAFGHLPGYGGAYKESVMLNGQWYDMVTGYGGQGASWGGLTPKGDSPSGGGTQTAGGAAGGSGMNLAPGAQLSAPLGRSDVLAQIQEELNRLLRGEPPRDELLEALG